MTAREQIADTLRGRILRGLNGGSIRPGDRLPSARDLRAEFGGADHRIILDAYRELAADGLVELRPRGGVYVARRNEHGNAPLPSARWLTNILAESISREIPIMEIHDWIRRAASTLRLRAVAVHCTVDQIAGLTRELQDDYGLHVTGVHFNALTVDKEIPADVRHADLLVTTQACEKEVRAAAERFGKTVIVVEVRPDLIGGEWRLLLKRPVYVVVRDEAFVAILRQFFETTPGAENIRTLIVGRDSLETIPDDAAVYITRGARDALGDRASAVKGRVLPAARLFSAESSRQLIGFIVRANLRAMGTGLTRA